MNEILLFGGGGHCKVVADIVQRTGRWTIAGIVEQRGAALDPSMGLPLAGFDDELPRLRARCRHALISVGQIKSPLVRERLFAQLKAAGFELPVIVSPTAMVAPSARIGEGSIVMDFAVVAAHSLVGVNAILNTRSLVEHDARVGDHCHVSTGAILNGGVQVGDGSFIGSASVSKQGIRIGARCIVAMGTALRHDLPDGTLFTG